MSDTQDDPLRTEVPAAIDAIYTRLFEQVIPSLDADVERAAHDTEPQQLAGTWVIVSLGGYLERATDPAMPRDSVGFHVKFKPSEPVMAIVDDAVQALRVEFERRVAMLRAASPDEGGKPKLVVYGGFVSKHWEELPDPDLPEPADQQDVVHVMGRIQVGAAIAYPEPAPEEVPT